MTVVPLSLTTPNGLRYRPLRHEPAVRGDAPLVTQQSPVEADGSPAPRDDADADDSDHSPGASRFDPERLRSVALSFTPPLAIIAVQLVLFPMPVGIWVRGAIVGLATALLALGMALIYRSNRIINFAQGDLGGAPGGPGVPAAHRVGMALSRGRARWCGVRVRPGWARRGHGHPPLLQRAQSGAHRGDHRSGPGPHRPGPVPSRTGSTPDSSPRGSRTPSSSGSSSAT